MYMYYMTYLQVHQLCGSSMPIQMYPKYVAFTAKHKMLKRFICVFVKKNILDVNKTLCIIIWYNM